MVAGKPASGQANAATVPRYAVGTISNNVLVGHSGTLFLVGGSHTIFEIVTGLQPVPDHCFATFAENIASRAEWASKNKAKYLHVIYPDKQSIIPEKWPLGVPLRIGEQYLRRMPRCDERILYPVDLLRSRKAEVISKIDTHTTDYGSIMVAGEIVHRLTGEAQEEAKSRLLATLVPGEARSGDLGSKLDPPMTGVDLVSHVQPPGRRVDNAVPGGNNGLVDLRFYPRARYDKRVLFFGDSFGREICRFLQFWFREVMFLRTGFFHPDIADLCRPDYLVTENVERYLDNCVPDAVRPNFFMYPHLSGAAYTPSAEFASVFSALLSVGRPPYRDFCLKEYSGINGSLRRA